MGLLPTSFLAVLGCVGQRDLYSSHSGSLYWPYDQLPLKTSNIITKSCFIKSESEQNPNQKTFGRLFFPPLELFTDDIITCVCVVLLTCSLLKWRKLCIMKLAGYDN